MVVFLLAVLIFLFFCNIISSFGVFGIILSSSSDEWAESESTEKKNLLFHYKFIKLSYSIPISDKDLFLLTIKLLSSILIGFFSDVIWLFSLDAVVVAGIDDGIFVSSSLISDFIEFIIVAFDLIGFDEKNDAIDDFPVTILIDFDAGYRNDINNNWLIEYGK